MRALCQHLCPIRIYCPIPALLLVLRRCPDQLRSINQSGWSMLFSSLRSHPSYTQATILHVILPDLNCKSLQRCWTSLPTARPLLDSLTASAAFEDVFAVGVCGMPDGTLLVPGNRNSTCWKCCYLSDFMVFGCINMLDLATYARQKRSHQDCMFRGPVGSDRLHAVTHCITDTSRSPFSPCDSARSNCKTFS